MLSDRKGINNDNLLVLGLGFDGRVLGLGLEGRVLGLGLGLEGPGLGLEGPGLGLGLGLGIQVLVNITEITYSRHADPSLGRCMGRTPSRTK
jgi:hypothetical protein